MDDRIKKAMRMGERAYKAGDDKKMSNPYEGGSRSFYAFEKGFSEAKSKAEKPADTAWPTSMSARPTRRR